MTVFARINHAGNAEKVDMPLRPTELLIFGNPKAGTILMQDKQLFRYWKDQQRAKLDF